MVADGVLDVEELSRLDLLARERIENSTHDDVQLTMAYEHSPGNGAAPTPGPSDRNARPAMEPRFQIRRLHARGGLGEVHLAYDARLKRQVALKAMLPELSSDAVSEARFVQEAELTAGLEHPGIVPVHALGRDSHGRPYYVMRFIEGETLKSAIARFHGSTGTRVDPRDRELRFRRLLQSLVAACNAVAYAHSRGVIHRDLKPENIMLGPFGETLVVDWGIAKPNERTHSSPERVPEALHEGDASLTRPGAAIGTPRYMSPEQALGDLDAVGPLSDVYGLGATLYHLLTGKAPFPQGGLTEILEHVSRGIFPAPRMVLRSIDPAMEAICLKAMSLRPSDRHESAMALGEAIEAWLADARYRGEQLQAMDLARASLARLGIERAQNLFQRERYDHGMLWLARALENVPASDPDLDRAVRYNLGSWVSRSRLLERTIAHGGEVRAIAFSPDGRCLGTAGGGTNARLWDTATGHPLAAPMVHDGPVDFLCFSRDGRWIATADQRGRLQLWEAVSGARRGAHAEIGSPVRSIQFSLDGKVLAAGHHALRPYLLNVETGALLSVLNDHEARVTAVALDPTGRLFVTAHEDGRIAYWNLITGEPDGADLRHEQSVNCLCFSHNGQALLAGGPDGKGRIWDCASRSLIRELLMPAEISHVCWNPHRDAVVICCGDGTARLWSPGGGRPLGETLTHDAPINCLAFSPDGNLLATGSRDQSVRLWETGSGLAIGPPLEHRGAVHALAFSPDGRRLATASADGSARVWRITTQLSGQVERISCWVRVSTGLDFDEGDAVCKLDPLLGWELQRRLHEMGGPLPGKLERG